MKSLKSWAQLTYYLEVSCEAAVLQLIRVHGLGKVNFSHSLNRSIFFRCGHLSLWIILRSEKQRMTHEWMNENKVSCPTVVSCNHLLFPLVTSALVKFMWPLPWSLTSMEKHLFEEKDSWHNPTPSLLMWFMLKRYVPANQCSPRRRCDSSTGRVHLWI